MGMRDTDLLSGLIGDIYDATLDPALWETTLKKVSSFVGGSNAALWSKDASDESGSASHFWGFDAGYVRAYFNEYGRLDPAAMSHFIATIGKPVTHLDLVAENEFAESRFYREWFRPQSFIDCMHVTVDKAGTDLAVFSVSRRKRDGVADEGARQRMQLLAPHIRRTVLVAKVVGTKQAEASALAETFDGLRAGMFLVDGSGRVVHANVAAKSLLAEGDIVSVVGGRLFAHEAAVNHRLLSIFAAAADSDMAVGAAGVTLTLNARSGQQYVAHVLPLVSGLRGRAARTYSAVAALFVRGAALASSQPQEAIAGAFQLTPTELNVLLAIVDVGGAPEVAELLGIAVSTVKTHLGRIYHKTRTKRHADLVKLVAAYANPLVG
jgi:DNA-binding CsgD family transcriptional regulator/PAS domain-containing protein